MTNIPRLSQNTLHAISPGIAVPAYDRAAVAPGIVHFGPGAFQRAHLASYVETLLPRDPRWGMVGLSLRSGALAGGLAAQDYLYTLTELDAPLRYRVLGAVKDYVAAPAQPERAFAALTHPAAKLVTITVTEKGYCLDARGGLDVAHPDIARDLSRPHAPASLIGWLAEGLARRRAAGLAPFIVMSCDNVAANGPKLRRAVLDYARALGRADLRTGSRTPCAFPPPWSTASRRRPMTPSEAASPPPSALPTPCRCSASVSRNG